MRLVVTSEARFSLASDGSVWTQTTFDYGFWQRYLSVFDEVRVVARALEDPGIDGHFKKVTGPGVEFHPIPYYLGPRQFFLKRGLIRRSLRAAVSARDAIVARVSSPIATELLSSHSGHAYGLEVVGDPDEGLGPGTVQHPLRPVFRWLGTRNLARQCKRAAAVAYVTRHTLQKKYPSGPGAFSTHYSSLSCTQDDFVTSPRSFGKADMDPLQLIFVGSLAQMYKGPDVLLHAIKHASTTLQLHLSIVGDGKHNSELQQLAATLGLAGRVNFLGALPGGKAIREQLDRATLFVLPSRTEGLPRAMIEAMARALPCIGTRVGGIPELLAEEDMVPSGDPLALAAKLQEVANPLRLAAMSRRNRQAAEDYRPEQLAARRDEFYRALRKATEAWIASEAPSFMQEADLRISA